MAPMREFLAICSILLSVSAQASPGWIQASCCPSLSCRPVSTSIVITTDDGYLVPVTGELITRQDGRLFVSQDAETHLCVRDIPEPERAATAPAQVVKCLFVPLGM